MHEVVSFKKIKNKIWANIFYIGNKRYIANIYHSYEKAYQDCEWRKQEITAYRHLLINHEQPVPQYLTIPIHQSEIPKNWQPLPVFGFLLSPKKLSKKTI